MKFGITRPARKTQADLGDRIARWTSFVALAALLAMATLPGPSPHRDVATASTSHWSGTWHG
ncbi:MAG TPA: hypothetical protein VFZ03_03005 [Dongiaceae bacterium]